MSATDASGLASIASAFTACGMSRARSLGLTAATLLIALRRALSLACQRTSAQDGTSTQTFHSGKGDGDDDGDGDSDGGQVVAGDGARLLVDPSRVRRARRAGRSEATERDERRLIVD